MKQESLLGLVHESITKIFISMIYNIAPSYVALYNYLFRLVFINVSSKKRFKRNRSLIINSQEITNISEHSLPITSLAIIVGLSTALKTQ